MKLVRANPVVWLALLAILSLGLITITDRWLYQRFGQIHPTLAIVADLRLTSLLIVSLLYALRENPITVGPAHSDGVCKAFSVAAIWLLATAYFVLVRKVWVPKLSDWVDFTAFMITGLLAEELLFRGILFDLCVRVFAERKFLNISLPVLLTAILFGLQHLGYHRFQTTPAALTQVVYTMVMGLAFGSIRQSTGRLWPVILVHMTANAFTVLRNLMGTA